MMMVLEKELSPWSHQALPRKMWSFVSSPGVSLVSCTIFISVLFMYLANGLFLSLLELVWQPKPIWTHPWMLWMTPNSFSYFTYFLVFWLLNCEKIPSLWLQIGCRFSSPLAPSQRQPRASGTSSFFCRVCSLLLCSFAIAQLAVGPVTIAQASTGSSCLSEFFSYPTTYLEKNYVGLSLHQDTSSVWRRSKSSDHLYTIPSMEEVYELILTFVPK